MTWPAPEDLYPDSSGPRAYITEISVPDSGGGGTQRLYSPGLKEPEPGLDRPEIRAQADALAEQSVRAAEIHGIPSRQHDAAMDAHAEHAWEHGLEPEAGG
jgi:hypothetical protein